MAFDVAFFDFQTVLFCVGMFLFIIWWLRSPKHLPPGPGGLPFVGNLLNFALSCYRTGLTSHELLAKLAHKYGPVFSMYIGGTLVVVLDKYDVVKEAFNNPYLNGRPKMAIHKEIGLKEGLGQASGKLWKQIRHFTITTLRSFGVGKNSFEENIIDEVKYLSQEVTHLQGKSFDPKCLLTNATANVICCVVFGKRFEYHDSSFKILLDCMDKYLQAAGAGGLQLFFPFTKYIQPSIHRLMKHNMESMVGFITNEIENHQQEHDTENLGDYIDVYLNEKQIAKKQNREFVIDNNNLAVTISDLFMAGTDTSASTLRWAILYMMAYPDIQDRIQRELDSVVGRNRLPRLADKTELPFTRATLLEIQRAGSIAPLGFMHYSQEDTTLAGYKVPKGSIVVSNLWSVHHDSELWDNPDKFNPERFLDDQGAVKEMVELIPFSIGRRICIGDHLAKMELFIFFTHLLHQFKFTKPEDSPPLSFEGITGIVFSPQPFLTQATVRQ